MHALVAFLLSLFVGFLQAAPLLSVDSNFTELKVEHGDQKNFVIIITNKGDENLIISDITASCGCMALTNDFMLIKPGEEAPLKVRFSPMTDVGNTRYVIAAKTNASNSNVFKHDIRVTVFKSINVIEKSPNTFFLESLQGKIKGCKGVVNFEWVNFQILLNNGLVEVRTDLDLDGPVGTYEAIFDFDIVTTDGKIQKRITRTFYNRSPKFKTHRPFTFAALNKKSIINDFYTIEIDIHGTNLTDFVASYIGGNGQDITTNILDINTVTLSLSRLKENFKRPTKGHIILRDKISKKVVFIHPIYITSIQ